MLREGDLSQPSRRHSDECRARIEERLRNGPDLQERIERADLRQNEYLARTVAEGDTRTANPVDVPVVPNLQEPTPVEPPIDAHRARQPEDSDEDVPPGKRPRESAEDEMPMPVAEDVVDDIDDNREVARPSVESDTSRAKRARFGTEDEGLLVGHVDARAVGKVLGEIERRVERGAQHLLDPLLNRALRFELVLARRTSDRPVGHWASGAAARSQFRPDWSPHPRHSMISLPVITP